MSVTAMYVELLVVGLGGLTWTALFISWGYNYDPISILSSLNFKNNAAVIIPFVLSTAYVLGILIDKTSKGIMEGFKTETNKDSKNYEEIIVESESATTVLNYMRSKIRIMRGYIFNWPLIGISAAGYLYCKPKYRFLSGEVFLTGIILAGVTLGLYIYNQRLCNKRIERFCAALKKEQATHDLSNAC
jgi:hypothetical protein